MAYTDSMKHVRIFLCMFFWKWMETFGFWRKPGLKLAFPMSDMNIVANLVQSFHEHFIVKYIFFNIFQRLKYFFDIVYFFANKTVQTNHAALCLVQIGKNNSFSQPLRSSVWTSSPRRVPWHSNRSPWQSWPADRARVRCHWQPNAYNPLDAWRSAGDDWWPCAAELRGDAGNGECHGGRHGQLCVWG